MDHNNGKTHEVCKPHQPHKQLPCQPIQAGQGQPLPLPFPGAHPTCTRGALSADPNSPSAALSSLRCSFSYGARNTVEARTRRRMKVSIAPSVSAPGGRNEKGAGEGGGAEG